MAATELILFFIFPSAFFIYFLDWLNEKSPCGSFEFISTCIVVAESDAS